APPSTKKPSPSGPRCATASVMRRSTTAEAGAPSRCTKPAMPHIASAPHRAHRETALLRVEACDAEAGLVAPAAHFVLGMAMRIARVMPVEVDVMVFLERERRIPECL